MKLGRSRTTAAVALLVGVLASRAGAQEILRVHIGEPLGGALPHTDGLSDIWQLPDFDGDGVADYAISAAYGSGPIPAGTYQIYSGATGVPLTRQYYMADPLGSYSQRIVYLGDFDGDGQADLANARGPDGRCEPLVVTALTGELIERVEYPNYVNGESYMARMTAVGDVNLDGYDDLVVTASCCFGPTVLHLGPDGRIGAERSGTSWDGLCSPGDLNGDGINDVVVAATLLGRITAYSLPNFDELYHVPHPPPLDGVYRSIGKWTTPMGDLDDDGVPDFAATLNDAESPYTASPFVREIGEVLFVSGADGELIRRVPGPRPRSNQIVGGYRDDVGGFGTGIEGGGDVNGDGYDDLVATSPSRWMGSSRPGAHTVVSGRTGTMIADLEFVDDPGPGVWFYGWRSRVLGDLDGDGYAEWAIASLTDETGGPFAGIVIIYRGFPADATDDCTPIPHSGGLKAELALDGPISVGRNDLWLQFRDAPANSYGILFTSQGPATSPFGLYGLCVGGQDLVRFGGIVTLDGAGFGETKPDFTTEPLSSRWTVGSTWTVQGIFRDTGAPSGVGTTQAKVIQWAP